MNRNQTVLNPGVAGEVRYTADPGLDRALPARNLLIDFSIVTPTFKQPDWLRLCAASVSDQEGVNVEHIIQDGGDGRGLEWLKNEPRARLYVEQDRGMYDALTKGISKSAGSIIAHLNSDEQYLPGALNSVKEFFDTHPDIDVLFGDAILIDAEGNPLSYRRILLPLRSHTLACHLGTLTCSTFFRRSLVERRLSYTAEWRMSGDAALVLGWLDAGVKMATIPQPLAVFTFTGVNLGASSEARQEGARRRAKSSLGRFGLPPFLVAQHRLRKFFGGAYQARAIETKIFTRKSPETRQTFRVRKLGFRWPKRAE
ncbi:MAG: glycosyltransferase [Chthoniobacterales bacterium]